ncbi:MAG TPA: hypothetical protein ENJ00_07035, partial [Phycisphaerales bacterium]|nr:hypothetical protein [Phycisphaerales bacterium]
MKTNRMITAGSIVLALMATNAAGQNSNWTNSSGGFWNDSLNWDALIPLNPSQDATLGLAGAYIVDLDTNPDIGILSITNPMATLRVPLGRTLGLNGPTATNNGRITVNHNGSSSNAFISINADTVLGGSGEVWLQTSSDNAQIAGAGTLTNSLGHTIRGVGRITAPMVNNGAVAADSSIAISGNDLDLMSAVTNNSMISAEAGSNLDIVGVTIDQTGGGGLFSANSGNINTVGTGSTIIGGTIDRTGTGEFNLAGTATLTGVTNNGFIDLRLGSTMLVAGTGLTNNGTVVLNRTGSSANSIMNFTASGNLDGTGEVQMQTSTDNSQLNADIGMTITHAATHTIRGVGQVNAAMINNGTISADAAIALSGSALELQINDKINNGDMTAEAGSILQIDGITIDQLAGGDLISNGGDINLNSATIEGGTYSAPGGGQLRADSGTELLSGVTLNGPMRVDLGTTVQVDGDGITNNGVMQINPDNSSANSILMFTADAALGGTGEIQLLSGTDNSQVNTAAGTIVTQAATHLIRGVGQVNAAMINNGEIRADATISFFGSDLDLRTNNKVNNNLMVAAMSSNLDINGIMIDQSGGGMLVADEGEIRLNGATIEGGDYLAIGAGLLRSDTGTQLLSGVTLNGPMRVDLGTTVQVDADGLTNNGIMQLNPDNSSSNSILLFTADAALGGTGEIQMRTGSDNSQI